MKSICQKFSAAVLALSAMTLFMGVQSASAEEKTPQAIVEQVTADLFSIVKKHNAATGKKTDAFFSDVEKSLDAVVDFPFIAKAVMGKSATAATPEQVEKFTKVFKDGLIKTYAKGIANYSESQIKTLPVAPTNDPRRVSVDQEVQDKGNTHKLSYTMMQNKAGQWKLINVVLNGVNLGKSFTSQFDQAMIKNNNDINKVIETWLAAS
jgi:phospholipid transport system substrate-binding protein